MAHRVVDPLLGYLDRMKKILADEAYEKVFRQWVNERSFGMFNFFRRLDKDHEKTTNSAEAWILWHNCQLILN